MVSLLILLSLFSSHVAEERVDLIEFNTYIDQAGAVQYEQVIFWDLCPECNGHHVRTYLMFHEDRLQVTPHRGKWQLKYHGSTIVANDVIYTQTTFDPEMVDRRRFGYEFRRQFRFAR